jgi:hypothetical protein
MGRNRVAMAALDGWAEPDATPPPTRDNYIAENVS